MPKYGHCWLGQAKPSVFTRLGAPRRLLSSRQGRRGGGGGATAEVGSPLHRQVGQSSGVRGLRSRGTRLGLGRLRERGRGSQPSCLNSANQRRKKHTSRNTST